MNQYIDRMPTDPSEREIIERCREVREIGFTCRDRVHGPWESRRYPVGRVPAHLAEVSTADIEAAIREED